MVTEIPDWTPEQWRAHMTALSERICRYAEDPDHQEEYREAFEEFDTLFLKPGLPELIKRGVYGNGGKT